MLKLSLKNHTDWVYADMTGKIITQGTGIETLHAALPFNNVGFAVFRIHTKNIDKDTPDTIVEANIILHWKGPRSSPMAKYKSDEALQQVLNALTLNNGYITVWGKKNLTVNNIYDAWRPNTGLRVLLDD